MHTSERIGTASSLGAAKSVPIAPVVDEHEYAHTSTIQQAASQPIELGTR